MLQLKSLIHEAMGIVTSDEPIEHVCVCGAPVERFRELCPDCKDRRRAEDRRLLLSSAHRSFPEMPWARWNGLADTGKIDPRVLSSVGHWMRSKGNLVLCGPSGCGKTTACVARARKILDQAERGADRDTFEWATGIRFATAGDLAKARRQWPLGDGEPPELEDAARATLLVLDDLGYEPQADPAIPELIDLRYRRGRLTITTTGLTTAELGKRYGEATVRKLIASGEALELFGGAR